MKAQVLLALILTAAGSIPLVGAPSFPGSLNHDQLPFTGTEGPIYPSVGLPPLTPDEDGIIRVRGVLNPNCRMTFLVPDLGLEPFAVEVEFFMNANIDTEAGPGWWTAWGECRGYITDETGARQCVLQAYYYSRRRQVAEALWVSEAEWLGTFCAGPLEGFGLKAKEVAESSDAGMVNGYSGTLTGVLIIPDSFDRPRPPYGHHKRRG